MDQILAKKDLTTKISLEMISILVFFFFFFLSNYFSSVFNHFAFHQKETSVRKTNDRQFLALEFEKIRQLSIFWRRGVVSILTLRFLLKNTHHWKTREKGVSGTSVSFSKYFPQRGESFFSDQKKLRVNYFDFELGKI